MSKINKKRKIISVINPPHLENQFKIPNEVSIFAENIIDGASKPCLIIDNDLRVIIASRSFYIFFNVNSKETIGNFVYDLGNRQWNISELRELLGTIIPQKTTFDNYEVELDFPAIGKRIMLLNARSIENDSGKEKMIFLGFDDISKRKKDEKALIDSELCYRRLFESAKDGILILDAETGMIVDVNPFLIELLGFSYEKFIKKEIWEIGFFKDIVANKDKFLELQQKEYVRYDDLPLETVDGRSIHVEFVSNVYMVNQRKVIQCNIRDITIRKLTETEIIESKKLAEELYIHLNDVRENERAEISREIHDELGQSLTALKMDINWTKGNLGKESQVQKKLNEMVELVNETIKKVQQISAVLRPGILDDLGLVPAIEWYSQEFVKRTSLQCSLELNEISHLPAKIGLTLFRIFQEGLTNIIRHANAKKFGVKLYLSFGKIYLEINDDGIGLGMDKIKSKDSLGLMGIIERLKEFNGRLEIISSKNQGTCLVVNIPLLN